MWISLPLLALTTLLLENTEDLVELKKTSEVVEVDPLLTDHPATKVEETVTEEEEDLTVDDQTVTTIVEVEEEEVTPETNDTLRAEEENDLTVPLLTETDTVQAEEEEEAIATVRAVEKTTVLRGTTVIAITDASQGGGIRGHPTLLEQGRGVPLEGKGLLLATRSRKITSFLKFQLRRRT